MLYMDDRHYAIKIDDIDRESHAQSMNAVAGDNPEAGAITEVTRSKSQQPPKPAPMRVGDRKGCCEVRLTGLIKGLSARRKNPHKIRILPSSAPPSNARR